MRVVLDTNVLVAAARSRSGASHWVMKMVAEGRCRMLCTPALFLEYEAVFKRPEHCEHQGRTPSEVTAYLDALAGLVAPVETDFRYRPVLDDADDDMVVEAAMNGGADAIVTHNEKRFMPRRGPALPVSVWPPQELLRRLVR